MSGGKSILYWNTDKVGHWGWVDWKEIGGKKYISSWKARTEKIGFIRRMRTETYVVI
jgi:hypothetical protein